MNVRCNCGHYYNTDVYDNVCPECEQSYVEKKEKNVSYGSYIDIDKHMEKLMILSNFYKGGKLDVK